jgi:hypothetical protein
MQRGRSVSLWAGVSAFVVIGVTVATAELY